MNSAIEHPTHLAESTLEALRRAALQCRGCDLANQGRTQVVFGCGHVDADLLIVGEAPGAQEDERGEPFVGRSGQLLDRLLHGGGLARADVYIANVVKCRPPNNRDPRPIEIAACSPWLDRQLQLINPKLIVTLGNFATRLMLDTKLGITKIRGQEFAFSRAGLKSVLIPTLHPAAVLRNGNRGLADAQHDFDIVTRRLKELTS